jgi:hypothetical protein
MSIRARTLLAGFMLVALVVAGSNLAVRPQLFEGVLWNAPLDPASAEAVNLRVSLPKQSSALEYSTQAEVFRFTLTADEDFTLRYLTVAVRSAGLTLSTKAQDWKVYAVHDGRPDFSQPVAYGEEWSDTFLKLRFSSSASLGAFGMRGENTFALVTSVFKKSGSTNAPWLTATVPTVLPTELDWAFVPGQSHTPWMDITGAFDSSEVHGLPTEETTRR